MTERGRRHFEDRAAARDLALLVRSKRVQAIRKRPPREAATALRAAYGDALVRLDSAARPPRGKIGYRVDGARLVFLRTSSTGRGFQVVVEEGRIARQDLGELAFVF